MRKSKVPYLAFLRVQHMPFKLIPEMPDCRRYRPGSRISQRTYCITLYPSLNVPQKIDIAHFSFSVLNFFEDLLHPAGSFSTRRTLTATFMAVETGEC